MYHTWTYQFFSPCLFAITWLLFVKLCATHTSTLPVCVYAPSTYSTTDATASELGRRRRSRPLTCSNGNGNLPRVWYPPTAAQGWLHKSCSSCRKHRSLCTLCGRSIGRTRRLCGRGGAQPWRTRALWSGFELSRVRGSSSAVDSMWSLSCV